MVTDEEIREVCAEWVRGEHFPIQDGDEQQLRERLAEDPEGWCRVLRTMTEELSDPEEGSHLAYVLAPLMELRGPAWEPEVVAQVLESRKAASVVAEAFDLGYSDRTGKDARLRAYRLFGREVVISTWLRYLKSASNWDFWPYALICEVILQEHEEAWALLTAMIEQARIEDLDVLGAGFLEDLLGGPLGNRWIERIERQAQASDRFRQALEHLWIDGDVSEPTFLRMERAAGVPLARARPDAS